MTPQERFDALLSIQAQMTSLRGEIDSLSDSVSALLSENVPQAEIPEPTEATPDWAEHPLDAQDQHDG